MELKKSFIIALTISIFGLIAWESYWRTQNYIPTLDDNKYLWAEQRAKVEKLGDKDIILTGSSRVLFDVQLDAFENTTHIRPLQLAVVGSSPLPIFHDLVENTSFNGTIIVGVTPGIFFSSALPESYFWERPQTKVDHYYNRTYAQRLNHKLSIPLQKNLVMISGHEEEGDENIDLKGILKRIELPSRTGNPVYPPFFEFGTIGLDRNMRMTHECATDTTFSNIIKNAWKFILTSGGPPPDFEGTTAFFVKDAKKFIARGGQLVLLRCPSTGMFKGGETKFFAREIAYDNLINLSGAKGYHYEDFDQLKNLNCPEWSHLSGEDADLFTKVIAKQMLQDGLLINSKTD